MFCLFHLVRNMYQLKYDVQGQSRTRSLGKDELLEQLPALQQLLYRLVGCQVMYTPNFVVCYLLDLD